MPEKMEVVNFQEHPAIKGEIYELHYNITSIPFVSDIQRNNIVKLLSRQSKFALLGLEFKDRILVAKIQIMENPFPIALVISLIVGLVATLLVYLSISKVFQIVAIPEIKKAIGLTLPLAFTFGILTVIYLLKRKPRQVK